MLDFFQSLDFIALVLLVLVIVWFCSSVFVFIRFAIVAWKIRKHNKIHLFTDYDLQKRLDNYLFYLNVYTLLTVISITAFTLYKVIFSPC